MHIICSNLIYNQGVEKVDTLPEIQKMVIVSLKCARSDTNPTLYSFGSSILHNQADIEWINCLFGRGSITKRGSEKVLPTPAKWPIPQLNQVVDGIYPFFVLLLCFFLNIDSQLMLCPIFYNNLHNLKTLCTKLNVPFSCTSYTSIFGENLCVVPWYAYCLLIHPTSKLYNFNTGTKD